MAVAGFCSACFCAAVGFFRGLGQVTLGSLSRQKQRSVSQVLLSSSMGCLGAVGAVSLPFSLSAPISQAVKWRQKHFFAYQQCFTTDLFEVVGFDPGV